MSHKTGKDAGMSGQFSLSKDKIKVVLLEGVHPGAETMFRNQGYTLVERHDSTPPPSQLAGVIGDAHIVGIRSRTQLTEEILKSAPKLIAVGCFCIGTNQVALETAAQLGIPVFNAPHSNTRSVAELVTGLTIMLMRGIFAKSMAAHHHHWQKSAARSNEVRGKTMGIVGYGHIGSQVSVLAESMGMQVIFHDILTKLPLGNARQVDSLETLLKNADVVTLHVPQDPYTRNMINQENLPLMRPGSYLINASRGSVVELEALREQLQNGHLGGAAVDVFPEEPASNKEDFHSPLIGLDNVILTPHIGGSTLEAQENIGAEVATKLINFSDRGSTEGAVNFPAVNLRPADHAHRILHIHENRPGMLRAINEKVAEKDINVLGQYLETNRHIGYVVLDIDNRVSREILKTLRDDLESVPGTIRTRLLY